MSSPIPLVVPVVTSHDSMQHAVSGMLAGQIKLSLSNLEPILVLANAVGVSHMTLMFSATW